MMDDAKFNQLMSTISDSKKELQEKIASDLSKLCQEVSEGQECTSQEVARMMGKRSYQFRKKGNEAQFDFNTKVEDHIEAARKELGKVTPSNPDKATVSKAIAHLDEGTKAIVVRQKHIKVADRSEFGWSVVSIYESDELAENSDDEKRLFKAEKEAERM